MDQLQFPYSEVPVKMMWFLSIQIDNDGNSLFSSWLEWILFWTLSHVICKRLFRKELMRNFPVQEHKLYGNLQKVKEN